MLPTCRIPLQDKVLPTEELPPHKQNKLSNLVAVYGRVDVKPLLEKIHSSSPKIWTDKGQVDNVTFQRAFHDKLGVKQVIFTFCDDLLECVYRLPWWYKWQNILDNIFERVGVGKDSVIRCLLANLPAGYKIPTHHDTGLWSIKSHRVHVPLVTSKQEENESQEVVFRIGLTEADLRRVKFERGTVLELNNRAKHQVENNWDHDRIHLIFDYVETPGSLKFQDITTNHFVEQTRRAIIVHGIKQTGCSLRYPNNSEIVGLALDDPERSKTTKNLIKLAERYDMRVFLMKCKRYSTGELTASEFAEFLLNVFGLEKGAKAFEMIFVLITDAERKDALKMAFHGAYISRVADKRGLDASVLPSIPRFIIIGAMKCGTTSLYEYINQHPEVCRANSKEPHFFDWKWNQVCKIEVPEEISSRAPKLLKWTSTPNSLQMKYLLPFKYDEIEKNPLRITGEATPSYLLGGMKIAKRIAQAVSPNIRIVVALRDPTLRAFSHYQMTTDKSGTPEQLRRRGCVKGSSFESIVEEDIAELSRINVNPQMDPDYFEKEYLDRIPMNHGSHSYVARGLYSLQLKQWFKVFPRNSFHFVFLEDLAHPNDAKHQLKQIFQFLSIDETHQISDLSKKNSRQYDPMPKEIETKLRKFYEPFICDLENLLDIDLSSWRR